LIEGTGITILADYLANTITINSIAGSINTLESLTNTTNVGCGVNEIIKVNTTGYWNCSTDETGGGSIALDDLSNTIITSPVYPSMLFYQGNDNWIDKKFTINTKTCSGTDKISSIDNQTGIVTCSSDNTGSGPTILSSDITCSSVSPSYCTIFTIPLTSSSGNFVNIHMIGDSNTAGVAIQMRVQFDNAGNQGYCTYRTYTTATAETLDILAATTTTDTGETVWLAGANIPMPLDIVCAFETDSSAGNALVQIQMETTGTGTIQKGSYYVKTP